MPSDKIKPGETIYIAPGCSQCRVYAIPYLMRPGQKPSDIHPKFQKDWKEIAMLDHRLKIRYVEMDYLHLKDEIEGMMGGTFFTVTPVETRAIPS